MPVDLVPGLSDEQEMLLAATNRFLESSFPIAAVRAFADGAPRVGADLRRQAGELGWYGLLVDERHGGGSVSDNGAIDAALIAAARGFALQPGPFVPTSVVAFALSASVEPSHAQLLGRLVSGETAATWAVDGFTLGRRPQIEFRDEGAQAVLSGTIRAVQDADDCETLLVTSLHHGSVRQHLVPIDAPGVHVRPATGLDLTRRFAEVRFDHVVLPASSAVAGRGGFGALVDRQVDVAAVLSAAEAVGAMAHDLELAVEYAKVRIAFGRPIGSFQAIKHTLADCSLWMEMAKAVVASAARAVGAGTDEASALASVAKSYVGERALELTQACFQVFGGIGYTWEHDHHLLMRRLGVEVNLFGGPEWHRARLLRIGGLEGAADHA